MMTYLHNTRITGRIARALLIGFAALALTACGDDSEKASPGAEAPKSEPKTEFVTYSVSDLMQPGPLPENSMGQEDAPVTIIEYSSMTCPHCANFHKDILPEIKSKYIDTGKVRYIIREFPLDGRALAGFMLARCVESSKYFAFVDLLYEKQEEWAFVNGDPLPHMLKFARQAGLTEEKFNACLNDQEQVKKIDEIRQRGSTKFGVSSTPTFYVNGKQIKGGQPIDVFEEAMGEHASSS